MGADSSLPPATSEESYGFFYGTLMAPEVFYTVCYRSYPPPKEVAREHVFSPAILSGFCRHRIQYADYPGVIADDSPGASVRGMVVSGLTAADIHHLDEFEGSEYDRQPVEVQVDGQEAPVTAQVYIFKYPHQLEKGEWDFEHFRREKMRIWTRADLTFGETTEDGQSRNPGVQESKESINAETESASVGPTDKNS